MIQSLDRGLTVLSIIARKNSAGVSELAAELGVDKSTVSRMLDTLKHHDMVQVDSETGKYRLGFRILHLGELLKSNLNVIAIARPSLLQLSADLRESVHLCAYNNNRVYVMDQVRSDKNYNLSATVGMAEPFHCSAVGKCILAYRRPDTLSMLLENYIFVRHTDKTITDRETLLQHLDKIRTQGYAVDDEELTPGVRCLAVPVFDYRGSVRYSIGVSGPRSVINPVTIETYIQQMALTAQRVSADIGYQISGNAQ